MHTDTCWTTKFSYLSAYLKGKLILQIEDVESANLVLSRYTYFYRFFSQGRPFRKFNPLTDRSVALLWNYSPSILLLQKVYWAIPNLHLRYYPTDRIDQHDHMKVLPQTTCVVASFPVSILLLPCSNYKATDGGWVGGWVSKHVEISNGKITQALFSSTSR